MKTKLYSLSSTICLLCILYFSSILKGQTYWHSNPAINKSVCKASNLQGQPQIVAGNSGSSIIVWEDNRNGHYDIYAQRLDKDGYALWTSDGIQLTNASGDQRSPKIISDGNGGAIIAWMDYNGIYSDIYIQKINSSGIKQWGSFLSVNSGHKTDINMISDGNGNALIAYVWQSSSTTYNTDIVCSKVSSSGSQVWHTTVCSSGNPFSPKITSDNSNGAIISWIDDRLNISFQNVNIYAQRITSSGNAHWSTNGNSMSGFVGGSALGSHSIAADGIGGAYLVWQKYNSADDKIYLQRVNSGGTASYGSLGKTICAVSGEQIRPVVIQNSTNGCFIFWEDYRSTNVEVYAQSINTLGNNTWNSSGVKIITNFSSYTYPEIEYTTDGNGGFIIVYTQQSSSTSDIKISSYNSAGSVNYSAKDVCNAVGYQTYPKLCKGSIADEVNVVWQDTRAGLTDLNIYAQYVCNKGKLGIPEIEVKSNNQQIVDGSTIYTTSNNTLVQNLCENSTISKTYYIKNTYQSDLIINSISKFSLTSSVFNIGNLSSTLPIKYNDSVSFTITYDATGRTAGNYYSTITIFNEDCDEANFDFKVKLEVIAQPTVTVTASSTSICSGDSVILTANGASTYNWSNNITNGVPYYPTGTSTYTVTGISTNGCTKKDSITVTVNPLPSITGNISGNVSVCALSTNTYSITPVSGATSYIWTLPNNTWSGSSNTNSITLNAGNTGGIISVVAQNSCGSSTPATYSITVNPIPNATVTNNGAVLTCNQTGVNYQWIKCNPTSIIAGATSQNYTVTANGDYGVIVTKNGCIDTSVCTYVIANNINVLENIQAFAVYPNPCTGIFTIQSFQEGTYSIINELGQTIQLIELNDANNYAITIDNLNTGIYFVVGYKNNQISRQKIVVTK